jgi:hypothetical protein
MIRKEQIAALLLASVVMLGLTGCPHRRHHDDHHPPPPIEHHDDHPDQDHSH